MYVATEAMHDGGGWGGPLNVDLYKVLLHDRWKCRLKLMHIYFLFCTGTQKVPERFNQYDWFHCSPDYCGKCMMDRFMKD